MIKIQLKCKIKISEVYGDSIVNDWQIYQKWFYLKMHTAMTVLAYLSIKLFFFFFFTGDILHNNAPKPFILEVGCDQMKISLENNQFCIRRKLIFVRHINYWNSFAPVLMLVTLMCSLCIREKHYWIVFSIYDLLITLWWSMKSWYFTTAIQEVMEQVKLTVSISY